MSKINILEKLYTARWYLSKVINSYEEPGPVAAESNLDEAIKEINKAKDLIDDKSVEEVEEPERPNVSAPGAKLLYYPLADQSIKHKQAVRYKDNYPQGVVIHFTAGQCENEQDMIGTLNWGKDMGYTFWGIGPTGKVYQTVPLSHGGSHAGSSSYPGLGSSVSSKLLGIEIACAGKTDNIGKSWFGKIYPYTRLRTKGAKDNCEAGTYVKYTEAQEQALINLLLWLKKNNPDVFSFDYVLGHDSVSPGRKSDPGWSLSMTIPEFQKKLKELYKG